MWTLRKYQPKWRIQVNLYRIYVFITSILISSISFGNSTDDKLSVHLLSYLSQDYGEAVKNGEIISKEEYQEQIEFITKVVQISGRRKYPSSISKKIANLKNSILKKDSVSSVSTLAASIKNDIIRQFNLTTVPNMNLNFESATKIYKTSCSQCHGAEGRGDGEAGIGLEPQPTNFHDLERMQNISPYQAYNTITLGINGTGMASYQSLTEQERWALAFYISSFRYKNQDGKSNDPTTLDERSVMTDNELIEKYSVDDSEKVNFLATVRNIRHLGTRHDISSAHYITVAKNKLKESVALYKSNKIAEANNAALSSYFEGVEPIEGLLKSKDESLVAAIEKKMVHFRQSLKNDRKHSTLIESQSIEIISLLDRAEKLFSESSTTLDGFLLSFGIVIRESLEAGLVILLLLSLIKKLNFSHFGRWVHCGWIAAIFGGAVIYLLMERFFQVSGFLVESVEAYVGLMAAGILLLVGIWFHRHSNINKWKEELQKAVKSTAAEGKKLTLFFIAFLAVFREIFETLLFVKILSIDGYSNLGIGLGASTAIAVAAIIIFIALKFSIKFNLGILFKVSTALILVLSVVLFGKSIAAFQKIGVLDSTELSLPTFSPLGFNSTMEVMLAQIILLVGIIWYFLISKRASLPFAKGSENA